METDKIIQIILGMLLSVGGWLLKMLYTDFKTLEKDFNNYKVSATEKFLMRTDFHIFEERLFTQLQSIENKIDNKRDK